MSRLCRARIRQLTGNETRNVDILVHCIAEPALQADCQSADSSDRAKHLVLRCGVRVRDVEAAGAAHRNEKQRSHSASTHGDRTSMEFHDRPPPVRSWW